MTNFKQEPLDWAFWFYWIMATTLGWLVGWLIPSVIPVVVSGVAVGAFQWAVLFKRIHKAWRWLLLSSLGWVLGYILNLILIRS